MQEKKKPTQLTILKQYLQTITPTELKPIEMHFEVGALSDL